MWETLQLVEAAERRPIERALSAGDEAHRILQEAHLLGAMRGEVNVCIRYDRRSGFDIRIIPELR
jgi:hypothetical protein